MISIIHNVCKQEGQKMKYLPIIAAAATFMVSTADVKAGSMCESLISGDVCERDHSKVNPQYWVCAGLFKTLQILCKGVTLGIGDTNSKLTQNQQACVQGGSKSACEKALDADVAAFVKALDAEVAKLKGQEGSIQSELDKAAKEEAKEATKK